MTKEEVRVITLSKLNLCESDILLDIGAGTGSLCIEGSMYCKRAYGIERKDQAVELIHRNIGRFKCDNLQVIRALAPEGLPDDQVNKIIIGGSGGKMHEIFDAISKYPIETIVINTITLENTTRAIQALKAHDYDYEVVSVNISKSKQVGDVTMMMGQNPINIITGVKNEN